MIKVKILSESEDSAYKYLTKATQRKYDVWGSKCLLEILTYTFRKSDGDVSWTYMGFDEEEAKALKGMM